MSRMYKQSVNGSPSNGRNGRRLVGAAAVVAGAVALAVAALVVTGFGSSDEGAPASFDSPAYTGGPRLAVDRTVADYGDVPYGYRVEAEFRVKNVGDQPLTFEEPEINKLDGC